MACHLTHLSVQAHLAVHLAIVWWVVVWCPIRWGGEGWKLILHVRVVGLLVVGVVHSAVSRDSDAPAMIGASKIVIPSKNELVN